LQVEAQGIVKSLSNTLNWQAATEVQLFKGEYPEKAAKCWDLPLWDPILLLQKICCGSPITDGEVE
jgi:hypothetical protein